MFRLDLQLFGGRGAGGSLGAGSGGVSNYERKGHIVEYAEKHPESRDSISEYVKAIEDLHDSSEFKDVADQLNDMMVAKTDGSTLAFYGRNAGLAINEGYLDKQAMDKAYDSSVSSGFHPSRGNKTSTFAVMSHEMGHAITDRNAEQRGMDIDGYSAKVIREVSAKQKVSARALAKGISGYAGHSDAECIAEAVADVRCNGAKASNYSKAIYDVLKRDYK